MKTIAPLDEPVVARPEYLTIDEAAAILRISRSHAYWLASQRRLPGVVRLGRVIRVRADVLLAQGVTTP